MILLNAGGHRFVNPDLSPRREASLEWWFVHGHVTSATIGRREFMLSVFRQAPRPEDADGHMLLLSVYDEATGRHTATSHVSPELVDHFVATAGDELEEAGVDPNLIAAYTAEIARDGVPSPIRLLPDPVAIAADPLRLSWGDLSLAHRDDDLTLGFRMPDTGKLCDLRLTPEAAWLREPAGDGPRPFGTMAYESCPRLRLTGVVDGAAVTGEAWIDHQWGDYGWLKTRDDGGDILGWDWLGINLADGADLMIGVRRNMRTMEPVSRFAVLYAPGAPPRIVDDVDLSERRRWLSRRSMIAYPVEWDIAIPSLGVDLVFTPAIDDQEIPVFGVINGIWEGVGRVEGTVGGKPATGRARLELNGYGFALDSDAWQRRWVDRIDDTLRAFLPERLDDRQLAAYVGAPRWSFDCGAQTEMLATPVWDLIGRGGKHWRPVYGLILLDALGIDVAPYETLISVIPEFVHNGSVIVDDIEDGSETRRGEATIHRRYGLPTAINAGNQLYFLPLLALSEHPGLTPAQRDEIYRVIVTMFVQAHLGQAQDLHWSRPGHPRGDAFWRSEDLAGQILQAHAYKTAAAVRVISEIVCVIAGADPALRAACTRFGESWGVAFQVVDDVNNFTKAPRWGKVRGEDIAAGKASYVTHKAISRLDGKDRSRLIAILDDTDLRMSEAGLAEGIALVERSGALEAARADAKALVEADWPSFAAALPPTQSKIMLRVFVTNLLSLPFEM